MDSGKRAKHVSLALVLSLIVILISMCVNIEMKLQGLSKADPVVIYSFDDESTAKEDIDIGSTATVSETYPYTFNQSKDFSQPTDNVTVLVVQSTAEAVGNADTKNDEQISLYRPTQGYTATTTNSAEILTDNYQQYNGMEVLTSTPEVITDAVQYTEATEVQDITSSSYIPPDVDTSFTYFVTNTGTKYHLSDCSYLSKSKIPVTYDEIIAGGYEPCSRCFK